MNISNNLYRIGAVSRLTGISQDALRIWERRYQAVVPHRSEKGGRLYSEEDVARLTAIKSLVDQGHAISTVANLSSRELNERLSRARPANLPELGSGRHDVCIVGKAITVRANNTEGLPEGLEGVQRAERHNSVYELILEPEATPKSILRQLVDAPLQKPACLIVQETADRVLVCFPGMLDLPAELLRFFLDGVGQRLDGVGAAQGAHGVGDAAFEGDNLLGAQCQFGGVLRGKSEGFIG